MRRLLLSFGLVVALSLSVGATAAAATISRAYNSEEPIQAGSIVSINPKRNGYIKLTDTTNSTQFIGIAVGGNDSLLAVNADNNKTQVASNGTANVLVSNAYGDIKAGDKVGVSPFSGVGAKAVQGSYVVGIARTTLSSSQEGAQKATVTTNDGQKKELTIGYIQLEIAAGKTSDGGDPSLNGLQKLVMSISGKSIPTARIVVSIVIACVAMITIVTLVYGSIYSGITSVGRNPLAKYSVLRVVAVVLVMVVIIAIVAALSMFFLLQ